MFHRRSALFFVSAAASLAAAQLGNLGVSQPCQNALSSAVSNSVLSSCLNLVGAISLFQITANTSIVPPLNSWLTGLCAADACDNTTLTTAISNITTGCQTDLANAGVTGTGVNNILDVVVLFYPTIRDVVCLKDISSIGNNQLCVTELLTDIQNAAGQPLSTNFLGNLPATLTGNSSISVPKNVTCSDCVKKGWSLLSQNIAPLANNTIITGALKQECGADFLNGTQPSDIIEGTGTAAPNTATTAPSASTTPSAAQGLAAFSSGKGLMGVALVSLISVVIGSTILI